MILGFYYHIPCHVSSEGKISMPSYQGLFIDSLAAEVDHLYCFLHTTKDESIADYWLTSANVTIVSLGSDAPAYIKTFIPYRFLNNKVRKYANKCDKIIVRGPSPLLHNFHRIVPPEKIIYFIVGSYKEGLKYTYSKWYRNFAIRQLNIYLDNKQENVLKGSKILVNSQANFDKLSSIARNLGFVYTTTLRNADFFFREDTCQSDKIKLLFTGRIDWAKGLRELIEAFNIIHRKYTNTELHFVGWEEYNGRPVQKEIEGWAQKNHISNVVFFHGKKAAGPELLNIYRTSDIYVLPSYHEGFPRTIWEAMASSLPVITTNVGSIPYFLKHKVNAFLIQPNNVKALITAICEIIENRDLRIELIKGGLARVSEVTLEIQIKNIIKFIYDA